MFVAGAGSTRIDVRSMWFLLLYASSYLDTLTGAQREKLIEGEHDNDLLDALAEQLARQVIRRLRSMLAHGYRPRVEPLTRVRGSIDHLGTARGRLMDSGRILCRYQELTTDLPRYRHVLISLRSASTLVESPDIRKHCVQAVQMLERSGVRPVDPTQALLSQEQYGRNDAADHDLILLSRLVRMMCAPEHSPGAMSLPTIVRDEGRFRRLFEDAVRGFYTMHMSPRDFNVGARSVPWEAAGGEADRAQLPRLNADIVLRSTSRQVVVECKFGPMFEEHYGKALLKPQYLNQVYAYSSAFAREFEGPTEALLLGALVRNSPGKDMDLVLDGKPFRVRQIDLSRPPSSIRRSLWDAISP